MVGDENSSFEEHDYYNSEEINKIILDNYINKYKENIKKEDEIYIIEYYNKLYNDIKNINIVDYLKDMKLVMLSHDDDEFYNLFEEEHTMFTSMLQHLILDEQYEKCILVKKFLDAIEDEYSTYLEKKNI